LYKKYTGKNHHSARTIWLCALTASLSILLSVYYATRKNANILITIKDRKCHVQALSDNRGQMTKMFKLCHA